jgi:tRNA pseudouridine38-40 synthase
MPISADRILLLTTGFAIVNNRTQANHMQKAEYIPLAQSSPINGAVRYPERQSNRMPENDQLALEEPALQNWKVIIAYDGTDFSGWQVQPGEQTIQGEIQEALRRLTGENPLPQGSGRTDAGVHALGQVASFALQAPIPAQNLRRALNRTLPDAIRILEAEAVPESFHARHSATAKTYEYRVFRETICPPALARYVHPCAWPMNFEDMRAAAKLLEGEHDFVSFAATDPDLAARLREHEAAPNQQECNTEIQAKNTIRTVFSSDWEQTESDAGTMLVYRVRGNGFLHHMVRNFVGTLLDVGRGRLAVDAIPEILSVKARAAAGPTAPARGLFLHSVEYGEKI